MRTTWKELLGGIAVMCFIFALPMMADLGTNLVAHPGSLYHPGAHPLTWVGRLVTAFMIPALVVVVLGLTLAWRWLLDRIDPQPHI